MIIVTGATGKIGGELVRRLAERGEAVRAVARHAAREEVLPTGRPPRTFEQFARDHAAAFRSREPGRFATG